MQWRRTRVVGWCGVSLLLAGCGLGADAADQVGSSTEASTPATTTPLTTGPAGTPAPDALTGFRCEPDSTGSWSAVGTLTNHASAPADYLVTVVVAGVEDTSGRGARREVPGLAGGDTYQLRIRDLPVPATAELTCQAQVLRR